ncbi:hypothetical protein O9H85_31180 [Paenibacillus filicis]|uniref:Uncharacterized protein n=1 Tax=Paenibacillus gyeongsangnamensis TaxID=3388067 RepID=A0ABT4QIP3_9BACL|nr:hypothetical protein [Paenibacillus filicis]MCZ8516750.1 hypothetical protein [Paenibacillus filicis]
MRGRYPWSTYIVLGLIALGILASIFRNPGAYIIPILVFGIIFWLYKFPPNRWRRGGRPASSRFAKAKRRNASFRVINGSKDSSDEPPKYH